MLTPHSRVCQPITELSRKKIRRNLRKNDTRTTTTKDYDWTLLNKKDIRDKYTLELRNKYDALQEQTETPSPNEEYENFVIAHLEVAAEFIPTKQRRKYRVPWETLAVREKHADVKAASKGKERTQPTPMPWNLKRREINLLTYI